MASTFCRLPLFSLTIALGDWCHYNQFPFYRKLRHGEITSLPKVTQEVVSPHLNAWITRSLLKSSISIYFRNSFGSTADTEKLFDSMQMIQKQPLLRSAPELFPASRSHSWTESQYRKGTWGVGSIYLWTQTRYFQRRQQPMCLLHFPGSSVIYNVGNK